MTVAQDADDLIRHVAGPGPLLHLRGEHARGDVAKRLSHRGIETSELITYRQVAHPLADEARQAIEGDEPAVLPLFSPRSARLVGSAARPSAALHVIAMSPAVAEAWREATGATAETCEAPTAEAMRAWIVAALQRKSP